MNDSTNKCYELCYQIRCKELINYGLYYSELNNYENYKDILTEEEFKHCMNGKQNRKNKRNRVKQKYKELYYLYDKIATNDKYIVFGTITLDNHYINLKEDTYIRKIDKWLKSHFLYSILNKDYGSKTEREHYHFIGLTTEPIEMKLDSNGKPRISKKGYTIFELENKDYSMGFEPTLCLVDLKKDDLNKTTSYLLKLNNHSTKLSTRNRVRIIKNPWVDVLFEVRKY